MSALSVSLKNRFSAQLRAYGPYAAIGMVVPGGSLVLLGIWVHRHRSAIVAKTQRISAALTAFRKRYLFD